MEWRGKWQSPCRSAVGEKLSAPGHAAGKLWFLDPLRQSAAPILSRRVGGVLTRGPEERSRGVSDVLGKEMNPGLSQSIQARELNVAVVTLVFCVILKTLATGLDWVEQLLLAVPCIHRAWQALWGNTFPKPLA